MVTSRSTLGFQPTDDSRSLAGTVRMLPPQKQRGYPKYNISAGASGHPAVIVFDHRETDGTVSICTITSLGETNVDKKFPSGHEHMRRHYVAVYPSPMNNFATWPMQLRLENGAEFDRLSYIKMDEMYNVPLSLLEPWGCGYNRVSVKFSQDSIKRLQQALVFRLNSKAMMKFCREEAMLSENPRISQRPSHEPGAVKASTAQVVVHSRAAALQKEQVPYLPALVNSRALETSKLFADSISRVGYGSTSMPLNPGHIGSKAHTQRRAAAALPAANTLPTPAIWSPRSTRKSIARLILEAIVELGKYCCRLLGSVASTVWRYRNSILLTLLSFVLLGALGYGAYWVVVWLAHQVFNVLSAIVAAVKECVHAIGSAIRSSWKWGAGVLHIAARFFGTLVRSFEWLMEMVKKAVSDIHHTRPSTI